MNKRSSIPDLKIFLVNLDEQSSYSDARELMMEFSNGATTVPQIFINRTHYEGGYTGLKRLEDTNQLDGLLHEPFIALPFLQPDFTQLTLKPLSLLDIGALDF